MIKYPLVITLLLSEFIFANSVSVETISLPSSDSIIAFTNGLPPDVGRQEIKKKEDVIKFLKNGTYIRKTLSSKDKALLANTLNPPSGIFVDKDKKFYYWTLLSPTLLWIQTPEGGSAVLESSQP